eukprot:TRINITY_DN3523_c0_g1_i1.p1 TRINITY_DN3523_c0_g1~~TRINITY_DN3523_c0_g1_i1.p1  ORF type:complete len:202 (+),score=47.34 TRINITY_DN3523_c0_g1_i1:76-681(+)
MAEERQSDFACLPDNSPFKRVLLKKCLKRIEKFNQLGIEQFLHHVVDSLGAEFNAENYSSIDAAELDAIVEAYKILVKQAVSLSLSGEQIEADLTRAEVSKEFVPVILSVLKARNSEIRKQLVDDSTRISKSYLSDFDWKLNLTMASDKIATTRKAVLLLNLTINSDSGKKDVVLELTRSEVEQLIATLNTINDEVKVLKV